VADLPEDPGFELLYPLLYLPSDLLQRRDVHRHPDTLHLPQNVRERQLHIVVEAREAHLFQLASQRGRERVDLCRPPGRLAHRRIVVLDFDLRNSPLRSERLELVASETRLHEVPGEVSVEVRPPHPEPLGVMHPQRPLRHPFGEPNLVLRDGHAPATVPDRGRRYRLEGELDGLLGDAHL
jgi:hypothetical protein